MIGVKVFIKFQKNIKLLYLCHHSYFDIKSCFSTDALSTVPFAKQFDGIVAAAGKCKITSAPSILFNLLLICYKSRTLN